MVDEENRGVKWKMHDAVRHGVWRGAQWVEIARWGQVVHRKGLY